MRTNDDSKLKVDQTFRLPPLKTHSLFFFLIMMTLNTLPYLSFSATENESNDVRKLASEYTKEERRKYAQELLDLGDELFEQKNYDYALSAYEQVFLFEPENQKASAKIDILRKQMKKEGKDETGILKGVYEEEAKERARTYWTQLQEYLKQEKYGQARLALEKILLLDPLNEQAQKLYEELKQKQLGQSS